MARLAGKTGLVEFDASGFTTVVGVRSWELDAGGDAIDVTGFNSGGAKEFVAGLTEWSVTLDAVWESVGLQAGIGPGVAVEINLYHSKDDTDYWYGTGIATSLRPTVAVDGAVTMTVTIQGTGPLAYGVR